MILSDIYTAIGALAVLLVGAGVFLHGLTALSNAHYKGHYHGLLSQIRDAAIDINKYYRPEEEIRAGSVREMFVVLYNRQWPDIAGTKDSDKVTREIERDRAEAEASEANLDLEDELHS